MFKRTKLIEKRGAKSNLVQYADDKTGEFSPGHYFKITRLGELDCDLKCPETGKTVSKVPLDQVKADDPIDMY